MKKFGEFKPCFQLFARKFFQLDEMKLHVKFGFFEKTNSIALFHLKVVLNIEKYHKDFCICKGSVACYFCIAAKVYRGSSYQLFENFLKLDFLIKFKARLHGTICFLQEQKSHFIGTILEKKLYYEHKCFFTGNNAKISLQTAYEEWEKLKKKEIIYNNCLVKL